MTINIKEYVILKKFKEWLLQTRKLEYNDAIQSGYYNLITDTIAYAVSLVKDHNKNTFKDRKS
jgi:hypothetical protein